MVDCLLLEKIPLAGIARVMNLSDMDWALPMMSVALKQPMGGGLVYLCSDQTT